MSFVNIKTYEIRESKNGLKVPIVNDVHLHSIYAPEREGNALLRQHANVLEKKSNVLILGLGFGYHIREIVHYFVENNRPYHIAVIEPNDQIVTDCGKLKQDYLKNVQIYCNESVEKLFHSQELIDFLLGRPMIIPHAPSFNLYKDYFTKYLTYKCSQRLEDHIDTLEDEECRSYFAFYDQKRALMGHLQKMAQANRFNEEIEFALAAFEEICCE